MYKITNLFFIFLLIWGLSSCGGGETPQSKSDIGADTRPDDVKILDKDMGNVNRADSSRDFGRDTSADPLRDIGSDSDKDLLDAGRDTAQDAGVSDFGSDMYADTRTNDVGLFQDVGRDAYLDLSKDLNHDVVQDMVTDSGPDLDIPDMVPRPENAPRFPETFIDLYGDIVNHQNTAASNFTLDRLSIVNGTVLTDQGNPLPQVKVSAPNFPDIGYVFTDSNGDFSFALNGGGVVNLRFTKTGFIDSERRVQSLWNEFVNIGALILKEYSNTVTTVNFSNSNQIQVARGDVELDYAGERQATLLVNSNTNASLRFQDGTTVDMPSLNIRFTEFTVGTAGPLAMPGSLPGPSAYTYALEISADEAVAMGAASVEFDKPVYFYVDDFIGFPVGTVVPIGYYSREKHAWIPSDNGRVVSIVSIVNGKAAVDIDGDGAANTGVELDELGFSDDELTQLASLYIAGKVLWRGPMTHLTPWDHNWPFGPPPDAISPKEFKNPKKPSDKNCEESGSIIECESGILRESIDVSGTPFFLNYSSYNAHYAPAYEIEIPLVAEPVPNSMDCALITVKVGGRVYYHGLSGEDAQKAHAAKKYVFLWDGKDVNGSLVQGTQRYTASLDFLYKPHYYPDSLAFARAFGSSSSTGAGGSGGSGGGSSSFITRFLTPTSPPAIFSGERCSGALIGLTSKSSGRIGRLVQGEGIGGWTLSEKHSYDRLSKTVHAGDGSRFSSNGSSFDVLSGGAFGFPTDRAVSDVNSVFSRGDILFKSDGTLVSNGNGPFYVEYRLDGITYYSNRLTWMGSDVNYTMLRLGPNDEIYFGDPKGGIFKEVDGTVEKVFEFKQRRSPRYVDENYTGPVEDISLGPIFDFVVATDGTIYVYTQTNSTNSNRKSIVWKVNVDGYVSKFLGPDDLFSDEDLTLQTLPGFYRPLKLQIDSQDRLYFVLAFSVYRFEDDGSVVRILGSTNRLPPYNYDTGDQADEITLSDAIFQSNIDRLDRFYFSQTGDHRLFYIEDDGSIKHFARPKTRSVNPQKDFFELPISESYFIGEFTFDARNNLVGFDTFSHYLTRFSEEPESEWIVSENGLNIYRFDSRGQHLETRNVLTGALVFSFHYDVEDRLIQVIDVDGLQTTLERDVDGDVVAIVGPYGHRNVIDIVDNRISTVTNANNESIGITYKNNGLIETLIDSKGQLKTYEFDNDGRLEEETDAQGSRKGLAYFYDVNSVESTFTSELGRSVTHTIDTNGDQNSLTRTSQDSAGFETTTRVLSDGNRTIEYPDGRIVTIGMKVSPTVNDGHNYVGSLQTSYPSGRTITVSTTQDSQKGATPSDGMISFGVSTTLDNQTQTLNYDGPTKTTTTTSPEGRVAYSKLDNKGRVIEIGKAGFLPTLIQYDTDGRLTAITQGTRGSSFGFDAKSNVNQITDALNRSVGFGFDDVGRVISQTLPDGRMHNFAFDLNGNVSSVQPAGRDAHTFNYNAVDQETDYTPPLLQSVLNPSTGQLYNLDHQPTKTTFADGREINILYDHAGRLDSVTGPLGTYTNNYSITTGLIESIDGLAGGSLSFEYDGDLMTKVIEAQEGVSGTVEWTYDDSLRMKSQQVDGKKISYFYDRDGNVLRAGELTLTRDATTGFVTNTKVRNVLSTINISGYGELDNQHFTFNGSDLFEVQHTYNDLGQITDRTETIEGISKNYSYTYDDSDRLTEVFEDGNLVEEFTFDTNDNVTERKVNGSTTIATYDEQDRLISRGTKLYRYNDHGQLNEIADSVSGDLTNLDYDVFGSLRQVSMPDGTIVDYIISANGQRVGKRINGTFDKGWLYGGNSRPIAEVDAAGNVTSHFVYDSGIIPTYMVKGTTVYRMITDHLGSIRQVVNASTGIIEQEITYDVFGMKTLDSNPGFQPFGYAGGLHDADTGFVQFSARDYDPESGRWMAKDPSGFNGRSANLYTYVSGDPINYVDPTGNILIPALLILDKVADVSALSYSAYLVYRDNIAGDCDNLFDNLGGLALDSLGFALPIAGLGVAWRSGKFAKKLKNLTCSFTEDTPVTMCDGTKQPIETIQEGDLVLSKNEQTGEVSCQTVRSPYVNPNRVIYELTTRNEDGETSVIETTDNHPFYVNGRGWTRVDELQNSDLLEGRDSILEVIEIVETNRVEDVYNFGVDGNHSYFVGDDKAWVHNCLPTLDPKKWDTPANWAKRDANHFLKEAKEANFGAGTGRHGTPYNKAAKKLQSLAKESKNRGDLPEYYEGLTAKAKAFIAKGRETNHPGGNRR